jgi:hypothetical protein
VTGDRDIEHRLQHGDVVVGSRDEQRAWCGHPQHPHAWEGVNIDGNVPATARVCRRCERREVRVGGGRWHRQP